MNTKFIRSQYGSNGSNMKVMGGKIELIRVNSLQQEKTETAGVVKYSSLPSVDRKT